MPIVRIKPYDPRKGHRLRSLIDGAAEGKRYTEGALYEVTAEEAERLAWFMQDSERVDPKTVVHGQARAFDIFRDREHAREVLEEEGRGALLQQSAAVVFLAPGRDAPETPALATEIQATDAQGNSRTFRGPPAARAAAPAEESFFDSPDKEGRPPTAKERRDAALKKAQARMAKT